MNNKSKKILAIVALIILAGFSISSQLFNTAGRRHARLFESYSAPQGAKIDVHYMQGTFPNCFDVCDSALMTISIDIPLKLDDFRKVIDDTIGKDFSHFKTVQRYDRQDYFVSNTSSDCVVPSYVADEYPGEIKVGDPCSKLQVYYWLVHGLVYEPLNKNIPGCKALSGSLRDVSFDKNGFNDATFKQITFQCAKVDPASVYSFFRNS